MKRELKIFLKRNKVQLVIAGICILITIKQMKAPFVVPYNVVTSFLFERVEGNTTWGEVLDLVSNLGFAYYSSLVFYYVVDYFPSRKREKVALRAVADHLSEITAKIEKLFITLVFVSGKNIERTTIPELCKLKLDNEGICCSWEVRNSRTGEIHIGGYADTICPFNFIQTICKNIRGEIECIYAHVNAENLEEEIRELLYALSENRYILNASELDGSILDGGAMSVIIACSTRDLVELQKIRKVLWKLPIEQYVCKMWKTTEDELKDMEIRYENLRRIAPDKLELFERIMKERSEE